MQPVSPHSAFTANPPVALLTFFACAMLSPQTDLPIGRQQSLSPGNEQGPDTPWRQRFSPQHPQTLRMKSQTGKKGSLGLLHPAQPRLLQAQPPPVQPVHVSVYAGGQEAKQGHPQGRSHAQVHIPHRLLMRVLGRQLLCTVWKDICKPFFGYMVIQSSLGWGGAGWGGV